ncbi:MAG TPA: SDR family NAD(P)-dependent oxidoreductase [Oscillospiraceae bacterium]|nr:SDR family NAD(P)-dependent oxidoreductase [Oscillospiraceae bacterium]HPF55838.1 SDR family NAD(P)-dependent oxidoreductase [Clostridiales bacterium]HPK34846.1 SDR family NAD(P)-dependent oxidoreductase [Oscillospiraceae bacterium]HPR76752.1 SDR family NAD(P)-dependent oxidoreductase [Oscillospiraceae bacterium]
MSLETIAKISNKYGANPEYVLAGGGNTSFKDADFLYIKGSGTSLATIKPEGFVKLDRKALAAIFEKKYPTGRDEREAAVLADMMAARVPGETKRPSVETLLHDAIPSKYVLHLHPAEINGMTCGKNGSAIFEKLFGDRGIWVRPIMPGYILATEIAGEIKAFAEKNGKNPDYILLENHGIFLGGESEDELDRKFSDFLSVLRTAIVKKPDFSKISFDLETAAMLGAAIRGITGGDGFAVFCTDFEIAKFVQNKAEFSKIYTSFSPDHMVYCKGETVFCAPDADSLSKAIGDYQKRTNGMPKIVGVEGLGYYAIGPTKKEADIAAAVFKDAIKVAVFAENFGGGKPLPEELILAISGWEVERYRKSVAFSGAQQKRAQNKIVLVTGSAQGFGKGIAEDLAKEGAVIAVADLNYEGACEVAEELCQNYGAGTAIGISANVGDEDSVREMIYKTVCEYGGLDALVSNAGIVRAGSLDEMTLANFELSTKINYTAFFLCSKYASKVMKATNKYASYKMADIIQINSKSGLTGSNKNFAYAGSKFGGLGLVQSFALELAPERIKVNAICPGNFLDGPLWTDPVKGLFVQYLAAGKVPGAKTVEDVKKSYESKVPLGRGCLVKDVVRAILYIMEQEYETGQAVPVTGGQEMLH